MKRIAIQLIVCALAGAALLAAQDPRGKVLGLVEDTSGAAVPGVRIAALHLGMNVRVTATSNAAGRYEFPFLLPGAYRVTAEAPGFKTWVREPVEVRVGDSIAVDIRMELGDLSESITVTAETSLLEASSASIGTVIDRRQLDNLPISGGTITYFATLVPNVTTFQAPGHNWLPSAMDAMSRQTVAGTRSGSNEYTLDGIPNMARRDMSFAPPVDAVQEFKISIVNYDASVGHGAGGNFNVSLKPGGNEFHGTARFDLMPNPWQANSFFQNKQIYDPSTGPVTPEKIKRLSSPRKTLRGWTTLSGPVLLPRLYDGRNRTFWMYGYQAFTRLQVSNSYSTVPSLAQREGDFSSLLAVGPNYQIYDPATIAAAPGGRFTRQPFARNIVPASRIVPAARTYFPFWPVPNIAGTADGRNNFQLGSRSKQEFWQHMARLDHAWSTRHRMFGRYTQSWKTLLTGDSFGNGNRQFQEPHTQQSVALDDVVTLTPSLVLNLRYGVVRFTELELPTTAPFDITTLGLPVALRNQISAEYAAFPLIAVDGLTGLGNERGNRDATTYHTWSGNIGHTRGGHSLRAGGEHRILLDNSRTFGNISPRMEFSSTWTRGPLDNSPAAPIGQGLASFLLGLPTGGGIDKHDSRAEKSTFTGLFVHDDWKVTRTFTVNVGLRWEYESAPVERYDRALNGFDFATPNPVEARARAAYALSPIPEIPAAQFRVLGIPLFAGRDGRPKGLWSTAKNNFAPRAGFAWQFRKATVLRGGYGIFHDVIGVDRYHVNQSGFSQRTTLVPSRDNGLSFEATLANPFPNGILTAQSVGPATFVGRSLSFVPDHRPTPYMQRWSMALQRELPGRLLAEISYVGNRGTRLFVTREYSPVPRSFYSTSPERDQAVISRMTAAVANPYFGLPEFDGSGMTGRTVQRAALLRPYSHYPGVGGPEPIGFSWYHSGAVRVEKRFKNGFMLTGNWTWSKFMEAMSFLNDTDPVLHRAVADQDRPHRLAISGLWELPFGKGRKFGASAPGLLEAVFGGWQVQGVYEAQTGAALGFGNVIFRGNLHDIPLPKSRRTPDLWFNTNAGFERDSAKQLAWNIRTFPARLTGFRAAGDNWFNLSALKQFRLTERVRLQLRTDWEGAMNTPQFDAPNTGVTSTLFGQVTGIRGEARRIWVGARLEF